MSSPLLTPVCNTKETSKTMNNTTPDEVETDLSSVATTKETTDVQPTVFSELQFAPPPAPVTDKLSTYVIMTSCVLFFASFMYSYWCLRRPKEMDPGVIAVRVIALLFACCASVFGVLSGIKKFPLKAKRVFVIIHMVFLGILPVLEIPYWIGYLHDLDIEHTTTGPFGIELSIAIVPAIAVLIVLFVSITMVTVSVYRFRMYMKIPPPVKEDRLILQEIV